LHQHSLKSCYPMKSSSSKLVTCYNIGAFIISKWEYTCNNKGKMMFWSFSFIIPCGIASFPTNSCTTFMFLNQRSNMSANMLWSPCRKIISNKSKKWCKDTNNLVQHPKFEINQFQLKITLNERWILRLDLLHFNFHGGV